MGSKLDITSTDKMKKITARIKTTEQSREEISEVVDTMILLNDKYFPDKAFRKYLRENFGTLSNDKIDCSKVKEIYCGDRGIASLQGIEYFKNLEGLYCSSNKLQGNLDLSSLKKLHTISCRGNKIVKLYG